MTTAEQLNARLRPLVAGYYDTHDEQLLGQILHLLRPALLGFSRAALGLRDPDQAEDLTQDVLLRLLLELRADRFTPGGSFVGYVFTSCRRRHRDTQVGFASRTARPGADDDPYLLLGPAGATQPDELPVAAEHAADASAALTAATGAVLALDPPARAAAVLHYYQGLPVPEAAARLGVDEQQYRTRLGRGLAALRTWGQAHPLADEAGVFAALPHVHTGDLFTEPLRLAS